MGIIEFFIIVIVVCVCAAAVWLIQYAAPGTPGIVYKIIWGVAIAYPCSFVQCTGPGSVRSTDSEGTLGRRKWKMKRQKVNDRYRR